MFFAGKKTRFYLLSFLKHDFRSSITVFFVALPLCLGISLASGAPVYSGLVAGIIGGIVVSLLSKSPLSVSGPAAGLTAICATAIAETGGLEIFLLSVMIAGVIQIAAGLLKLGGFTHLIPTSVIKGMLAAIGLILISKQIPLLVGYNKPDFWTNELFNIITLDHAFEHIDSLYHSSALGVILVSACAFAVLIAWKSLLAEKLPFIPASFVTVLAGVFLTLAFAGNNSLALQSAHLVNIPQDIFSQIRFPDFSHVFSYAHTWKYAVIIAFVASLETLLGLEAIDKLDPQNRITPQNRELVAQGCGNFLSGMLGGLPITAVIVRASANAEAGARTKLSSFTHGVWLLFALLIAIPVINLIPYCVLAVILVRTGYNLAKPRMFRQVYRQGREQFLPFIVTIVSVLLTDLLIGLLIGFAFSVYFLVKHTYRAGYVIREESEGHHRKYVIELALNVSFLNKKKFREVLDGIPPYSVVEINGSKSVYIDHDILEIFQEYRSKAHNRHIQLELKNIPEVEIIELH
jgi:MFS superfamily sulfate permease-like transporter